jgi:hypothetical protein
MLKKCILISLVCISAAFASEEIVDFEEKSVPVLNEELRTIKKDISSANSAAKTYTDSITTINTLTEKGTLVNDDLFIIEDSAASNAKKKTKWSSVKYNKIFYTTSGTFVAPAGITTVYLTMVGGGGAGHGDVGGGGGGGGASVISRPYTVTPSNSYTVTVGGASQDSVFDALTCDKGVSASSASGGSGGGGIDGATYTAADGTIKGGNGGDGVGTSSGGSGGGSPFGKGGTGGTGGSPNGTNGSGYGAGGGGPISVGSTGAGSAGFVLVEW